MQETCGGMTKTKALPGNAKQSGFIRMKKNLLVPGAAAALLCSTVAVPAASAQQTIDPQAVRDLIAVASAISEQTDASSTGTGAGTNAELSPLAIAAIVIGSLAAVGAGSVFAIQQGWVQLPPDLARAARELGVPVPAPASARGNCSPQAFDAVVPGWPKIFGTSVSYCDGKWAVAGANGTDWTESFKFVNGKWTRIKPDGTTSTGMTQGCYNGIKLRQQGAPEAFMRRVTVCKPSEIGR